MPASLCGVLLSIFFLFIITSQEPIFSYAKYGPEVGVEAEMVPYMEAGKGEMVMRMMMNESRRKLGSFQICALCTCCGGGGANHYCLATPCCYAINCNIPNRPFGFCSFTPKTCNCLGCHL